MRRTLSLLLLTVTANAWAVAPQFWRVSTADEFLAGEIEGFAVTSRGELRSGPSLTKIASFTDPFVLSQVTAPNGDRFFGTGNDGKVYRLRGQELKPIFTASEPEIYAVAWRDGQLYAASSPNGKIYRIDPDKGSSATLFDPRQAYIWALHFTESGDLFAATGVEGKLFRISRTGEGKVLFDAPETHLRSLASRRDGTLLVGGAGKGRIYEVRTDGAAHALYDSALSEISAIHVDASGVAWAAGASSTLPSSAPAKPATKGGGQGGGTTGTTSSGEAKKDSESAPSVEVSFAFEEASAGGVSGSGELYRIHPDGFVEIVRKFERELIYAINGGSEGAVLLSTGPQGRVYSFKDGEVALLAAVPEKQVVSISIDNGTTLVTTTNSGAVYRVENGGSAKAEFRSAAKDVERFSRFGHYRIEGSNIGDGRLAISFRSGNTRTPDATWSSWSAPLAASEGTINAPPGRYIQWKLTTPKGSADLVVDGVSVAFINRNVPPVVDAVSVQEPAVVYISSSYPPSPQVVEATNPDEYGIFTSLDTPREKNEQGKRMFRKGFRTVTWRAHDDNGDNLRYALFFRPKDGGRWLRLRDNVEETQINFDTSQIPDGIYQLRLLASDALDNPENPLTDAKEGIEFQVDNTPPVVNVAPAGDGVTIRISDQLSPIGKVEYSADAQKWIRMTPGDGISDSREETFRLPRNAVAGKFVIVRAVDGFYNVATQSVTLP